MMDSKKDLLVRIGNVIESARQARTGKLYHTAPTWAVALVDTVCGLLEEAEGHLREQDAEIMRLQDIVAKLPKTADGVPVVPNVDPIWIDPDSGGWVGEDPLDTEYDENDNPIPGDPIQITTWAHWEDHLCILVPVTEEHFDHWSGKFYSTCEAAREAALG